MGTRRSPDHRSTSASRDAGLRRLSTLTTALALGAVAATGPAGGHRSVGAGARPAGS